MRFSGHAVGLLILALVSLFFTEAKNLNRNKIERHSNTKKGSYIVQYNASVTDVAAKANGKGYNGKEKKALIRMGMVLVKVGKESDLDDILGDPDVLAIEEDSVVTAYCDEVPPKSWGQDRIDQENRPTDSSFRPNRNNPSGDDVYVYVVDTGIDTSHPQFEARASHGPWFIDNGPLDENGHGTHCAGVIGSYHHGVNRDVKLVGVKVLDSTGSGFFSGVIEGIQWVQSDHEARGGFGVARSIINLSLGGPRSSSVNRAVRGAFNDGISVVVAAGNSNDDAFFYSPASTNRAITVGATFVDDTKASFSNYGSRVDLFAPGVNIVSTWIGSRKRRSVPRAAWQGSAAKTSWASELKSNDVYRYRRNANSRPPTFCAEQRCDPSLITSQSTSETTSTTASSTTSTTTSTTSSTTSYTTSSTASSTTSSTASSTTSSTASSTTFSTASSTTSSTASATTSSIAGQRPVPPLGSTAELSGTSMASPFAAGVVSLMMMNSPTVLSATDIQNQIKAMAHNKVIGVPDGTTTRLLYTPPC